MEKKKKYTDKALAIFKQEGLRMSLEELAQKMGIAKKTLYNHFSSKEELISACMQEVFSDLDNRMKILVCEDLNAIECLRISFAELQVYFQDHSPLFIRDLNRFYPEMVSGKHTSNFGQFGEKIVMNLEKGIREGIYHPDINVELISKYFVHSVFGFFFHSVITDSGFSTNYYFDDLINYHLRALVNEKGRLVLTQNRTV